MAFICSLLLSAIAVCNSPVLNRDGMFYVEWAREIAVSGFQAARQYDPLYAALPVAIHLVSTATGLAHEAAAQLLNALFMAGACALLVAIVRRRKTELAWMACLVVLAMPAYNEYRGQVLREFGFWFFSLLALWFALRWETMGRWREALACQVAVLVAAMFRTEALAYLPALMLWQAFSAPSGMRLHRVFAIGCLSLGGAAVAALLLASGLVAVPERLLYIAQAFNPVAKFKTLNELASRMSDVLFGHKYTREEAVYVLFLGLLTIVPVKFLKMSGVLIVPMAYGLAGRRLREILGLWQPLGWIFLGHALALAAFVSYKYFLVGRHVAMLNLLAVPVAAAGLLLLMRAYPHWRSPMFALVALTALANVVSLSPKNTQIVEAGRWLAANRLDTATLYIENPRVAYYAGLRYAGRELLDREVLAEAMASGRYTMVVLDFKREVGKFETRIAATRFRIVQRFANRAGDIVVVAVSADVQPSSAMTERSRPNTGSIE